MKKILLLGLVFATFFQSPFSLGAEPSRTTLYDEGGLKLYAEDNKLMAEDRGKALLIVDSFDPQNDLFFVSPNQRFIAYFNNAGYVYAYDFKRRKSSPFINLHSAEETPASLMLGRLQWSPDSRYLAATLQGDGNGFIDTCVYQFSAHPVTEKYCLSGFGKILYGEDRVWCNWAGVKFGRSRIQFHCGAFEEDYGYMIAKGGTDSINNGDLLEATVEGKNPRKIGVVFEGREIRHPFKDLGIQDKFWDEVSIANDQGWAAPYSDDTARPQNPVTRAEFAAMAWKAFGGPKAILEKQLKRLFDNLSVDARRRLENYPSRLATIFFGSDIEEKRWVFEDYLFQIFTLPLEILDSKAVFLRQASEISQLSPEGVSEPTRNILRIEALGMALKLYGGDFNKIDERMDASSISPDDHIFPKFFYNGYPHPKVRDILEVDEQGELRPEREITRGEAAQLILRMRELK